MGGNLGVLESLIVYSLSAILLFSPYRDFVMYAARHAARTTSTVTSARCSYNLVAQLCLFIPVVQLPCLIKSRMSYVDIGWPCGVVLLSLMAFYFGTGCEPVGLAVSFARLLRCTAPGRISFSLHSFRVDYRYWVRKWAICTCFFLHGLYATRVTLTTGMRGSVAG